MVMIIGQNGNGVFIDSVDEAKGYKGSMTKVVDLFERGLKELRIGSYVIRRASGTGEVKLEVCDLTTGTPIAGKTVQGALVEVFGQDIAPFRLNGYLRGLANGDVNGKIYVIDANGAREYVAPVVPAVQPAAPDMSFDEMAQILGGGVTADEIRLAFEKFITDNNISAADKAKLKAVLDNAIRELKAQNYSSGGCHLCAMSTLDEMMAASKHIISQSDPQYAQYLTGRVKRYISYEAFREALNATTLSSDLKARIGRLVREDVRFDAFITGGNRNRFISVLVGMGSDPAFAQNLAIGQNDLQSVLTTQATYLLGRVNEKMAFSSTEAFIRAIDANSDNVVSKEEVDAALQNGTITRKLADIIDNGMFFTVSRGDGIFTAVEITEFNRVITVFADYLLATDLKGVFGGERSKAIAEAIRIYNDENTVFENRDIEAVAGAATKIREGALGTLVTIATDPAQSTTITLGTLLAGVDARLHPVVREKFAMIARIQVANLTNDTKLYAPAANQPFVKEDAEKAADEMSRFLAALALMAKLPKELRDRILGTERNLPELDGALTEESIVAYVKTREAAPAAAAETAPAPAVASGRAGELIGKVNNVLSDLNSGTIKPQAALDLITVLKVDYPEFSPGLNRLYADVNRVKDNIDAAKRLAAEKKAEYEAAGARGTQAADEILRRAGVTTPVPAAPVPAAPVPAAPVPAAPATGNGASAAPGLPGLPAE